MVQRVCTILHRQYGLPRLGNPANPLSDLIYIMISNKTSPRIARRTYRQLRVRYGSWEKLLSARLSELRSVLRPAGLASVKSRQIQAALRTIRTDFGTLSLAPLKKRSTEEAQRYLAGLPGASEKVAKCVLMYTLNRPVLPVDTHVHRVSFRLGWTARKRADQSHAELEALVPEEYRKAFHVACIAHGREICRPRRPLCHRCPIMSYCRFFREGR